MSGTRFHSPRSCSMAVPIAPAVLQPDDGLERVSVARRATQGFRRLQDNPKGRVPGLRIGAGRVLTGLPAAPF
jgi:hypothetical protein